jgi:hypothetical protein
MHTRPKKIIVFLGLKYCLSRLTPPYIKCSACNPSYLISFSQQAQSWNICMTNISNAKKNQKKKNPGHLYLTLFTGIPVTLSTQLIFHADVPRLCLLRKTN